MNSLFFEDTAAASIDDMPEYGLDSFRKLIAPYSSNLGISKIRRESDLTSKVFGQLLGAKVSVFHTWSEGIRWWNRLGPLKREELGEDLNDAYRKIGKIVDVARGSLPNIVRKAFLSASRQPLVECAEFHEGYGLGLGFMPRIQAVLADASAGKNLPKLKREIMTLYISQFWPRIEEGRIEGGWPRILEDFQAFVAGISDSLEIDEETFRKTLQRAGIKGVGQVGAPKKSGQSKAFRVPK